IDLAAAAMHNDAVGILLNNGDGTFQPAVYYACGDYPNSVFAVDLDGDTDNDLAVVNGISANISVLMNNGDGTFQDSVNYGNGNSPSSVFAADFDNDNDNDLVMVNQNSVTIFLNNGDGTFETQGDYSVGDVSNSVFAADLDGDTDIDLAVSNRNSNDISVLMNITIVSGIDNPFETPIPEHFSLSQNYPNPFNPVTTIKYQISEISFATIKVYDVLGNEIEILVNEEKQTGTYELTWYAEKLPSGVYFYRLKAGDFFETKKMILLK
ncbi:MAG: T9SS type A sorting domain-containing protein, partial [Ignavibacteria bacterium]|nr:T9SS type A sorting domain-containing protein [Ignavibacteria bacterium]